MIFNVTFPKFRFSVVSRGVFCLLSLWAGCALYAQTPQSSKTLQKEKSNDYTYTMEMLGAVLGMTQNYFVDSVSLRDLHPDAINYMLQSLDPYTMYMPKKEANEFRESTSGQYGGIGAILRQRGSRVIIDSPMQNKPADKAGMKSGDWILKINGRDFSNSQVADVRNELRGVPGEKITITIRREGIKKDIEISLIRELVDMNPISYHGILSGDVGYLRLSSFTTTSHIEVGQAIQEMQEKKPLKGLVLDLRDNGGGVLQSAVEIVGMFVPQNSEVVQLKSRGYRQNYTYRTPREPIYKDLPLVVLLNASSASASEIVAGALQDYDRAVIIGQKSYGKGLVQSTMTLPDSAILKLTTAHYYIPSGRNIQRLKYDHKGGASDKLKLSKDEKELIFHTKNGREVKSSGGITPDIFVAPDTIPRILGSLLVDTLTFDFISQYVREHPQKPEIATFELSDKEYEAYARKVIDHRFEFYSPSTELIKQLEQVFAEEKRKKQTEAPIEALKSALTNTTEEILREYKKDILSYLNMNIIERYYYSQGSLEYYIPKDRMVKESLSLIASPKRYAETLRGTRSK